jgi:hypothetical protein
MRDVLLALADGNGGASNGIDEGRGSVQPAGFTE